MTDCEIIKNILSDGQWHNIIEIMQIGKPNAINWAVRSRISDLDKKLKKIGKKIDHRLGKNRCAEYRIIMNFDSEGQGVLL